MGYNSRRVDGASTAEWMKKRVRRPRDPLTASMVAVLEHLVEAHPSKRTRVFAGFLAALVHWRARVSEGMLVRAEPTIDYDPEWGTSLHRPRSCPTTRRPARC